MKVLKSKSDTSYDKFVKNLRKKGYRRIGSGVFGEVYATKRSRHVIKIGITDRNEAYLDFLNVVKKNQKNPHFPKIHSLTKVIVNNKSKDKDDDEDYFWDDFDNDDYFIVKMERLKAIGHLGRRIQNREAEKFGVDSIYDFDSIKFYNKEAVKRASGKHRKEAIKKLHKLLWNHGEDLHTGNLMWRIRGKKKQLVITDPVC